MYDIEIKDLSVSYDNVEALKNINLKVKNKEFMAIIGPNGGGKSTLLKALLGLIKPTKGSIDIKKGKGPIGYVPQFSVFDKEFPIKVLDVILMGKLSGNIRPFHKYTKKDILQANRIMEKLDILDFKNRQISQLSGGQMQKVLIARALIMNPSILLLDEPTASLDSNAKNEIYELLKFLNKSKTIIMVSHDIGVISPFIDSVACLNKTLHYHGNEKSLEDDIIEGTFGCAIEAIRGFNPKKGINSSKEEKDD